MTEARATFSVDNAQLNKFTVVGENDCLDSLTEWGTAVASRQMLKKAMSETLTEGKITPLAEARGVALAWLGWQQGVAEIVRSSPTRLRLTVSAQNTAQLVLEQIPVDASGKICLDQLLPVFRIFNISQPAVTRPVDFSVALVYQNSEWFPELARNIAAAFRTADINYSKIPGDYFTVSSATGRVLRLQAVFSSYRAIVFLGHLHTPPAGSGGWKLSEHDYLSIKELKDILAPPGQRGNRVPISRPEVVFTLACSGAWGDEDQNGALNLFYPEVFLTAGVQFFIGSWMDVILGDPENDKRALQTLIVEFVKGWRKDPKQSVTHLYTAKQACSFRLLTTLYQIYVLGGVEPEEALAGWPEQPVLSAVVSALQPGDRLSEYELHTELWSTPYARTFWARKNGDNFMLQVLADEWQHEPALPSELEQAIEKLRAANLGTGHLIPERSEKLLWGRNEVSRGGLLTIVYSRPSDEAAEQWSSLDAASFTSGNFLPIMELGFDLALRLAELHARQIYHGNLDHSSLVYLKEGERSHLVLKDAWVRQIQPARTTYTQYAAPEEFVEEDSGLVKADSWGLGVILYKLSTGHPPVTATESAAMGQVSSIRAVVPGAPEGLERITRQCLTLSPVDRPAAGEIAARLSLAILYGGDFVSNLEQQLALSIQAGYRLFAITTSDIEPLRGVLALLARHKNCDFYEAIENVGLRQVVNLAAPPQYKTITAWLTAEKLNENLAAAAWAMGQAPPTPLDQNQAAAINGTQYLSWAANLRLPPPDKFPPLLLIHGCDWWESRSLEDSIAAWRLLKLCQQRQCPVLIIADNPVALEEELERAFVVGYYPPPSPSELFEQILAAPHDLNLPVPPITADQALNLAHELYPAHSRDISDALRMNALQHGVIDEYVIALHDEQRAQIFHHLDSVNYLPLSRLPHIEHIGLPPTLDATIKTWAQAVTSQGVSPQRLLISGASGCGKTALAQALARLIQRPVLAIEADRCLRGGLGESERALQRVLAATFNLNHCVLLLDNIDRFWSNQAAGHGASSLTGTLGRMADILLQALDQLPPGFTAILTATKPQSFPPQWRRRIELHLNLNEPPDESKETRLAYRSAVFAALFRKHGLNALAGDNDLLWELAANTHPEYRPVPLPGPLARRFPNNSLKNHTVRLDSGADIEHWITETIYLHATDIDQPQQVAFWRQAIQ